MLPYNPWWNTVSLDGSFWSLYRWKKFLVHSLSLSSIFLHLIYWIIIANILTGLIKCLLFSIQSCQTLCDPMDCSMPGFPVFIISQNLLKLMFIELIMPSNYLILCCPLLFLPSVFPSIRVFSNESALHIRWPKHWSFSFSISPSNEYLG